MQGGHIQSAQAAGSDKAGRAARQHIRGRRDRRSSGASLSACRWRPCWHHHPPPPLAGVAAPGPTDHKKHKWSCPLAAACMSAFLTGRLKRACISDSPLMLSVYSSGRSCTSNTTVSSHPQSLLLEVGSILKGGSSEHCVFRRHRGWM